MHFDSSARSPRSPRTSSQVIATCGVCGGPVTLQAAEHCPDALARRIAALVACDRCARTLVGDERRTIARAILPFVRLFKLRASRRLVSSFLALAKRRQPVTRQAAADVETILAGAKGGAR